MNTLNFVDKYRNFYLPPYPDLLFQTAHHLTNSIKEVSHCLKIPFSLESPKSMKKHSYQYIRIVPRQKHSAFRHLETVLDGILSTPLRNKDPDPLVNAILDEGFEAIQNTLLTFRNVLQKRKLRDRSLLEKTEKSLVHLEKLIIAHKKELPKRWFSKAFSCCVTVVKVSAQFAINVSKGLLKSVVRHKKAYTASAVIAVSQKVCVHLASPHTFSSDYCPKTETSWNPSLHIPLIGFNAAFIALAIFVEKRAHRPFVRKDPLPISYDELDDQRFAQAHKTIETTLHKVKKPAILIKLVQNHAPGESASTFRYHPLKIKDKCYVHHIITLRKKGEKFQNDIAEETTTLHELGHILAGENGRNIALYSTISSIETFALRLLLPTHVPFWLFNFLFEPVFATNPKIDKTAKGLKAFLLCSAYLIYENIPYIETISEWSKSILSDIALNLSLTRYKKMQEERDCDQLAMTYASMPALIESSQDYRILFHDEQSIEGENKILRFATSLSCIFNYLRGYNQELWQRCLFLLSQSYLLVNLWKYEKNIHPPHARRSLYFANEVRRRVLT